MQNAFRFLLGLALAAPLFIQAQTGRDIGVVSVEGDNNTIPITINSASPELQNLALTAFKAHGRFSIVASRAAFSINFASAGTNQVTVTITKNGATVATQTVTGT